jgi:hypothetical protein
MNQNMVFLGKRYANVNWDEMAGSNETAGCCVVPKGTAYCNTRDSATRFVCLYRHIPVFSLIGEQSDIDREQEGAKRIAMRALQ